MTITRSAKKTTPLHDPARQVSRKAIIRAERRHKYEGMTPDQMCRSMGENELNVNAKKGGIAAIAEVERRMAERSALPAGGI